MSITNATMALLAAHAPQIARPADADYAGVVRLVRDSDELARAFAEMTAGAGGIIELAAGAAPFRLSASDREGRTDAPVLIRSADPDAPAVLEHVSLSQRENVAFAGVTFHAEGEAFDKRDAVVDIWGSQGIGFYDSTFSSVAAAPAGLQEGPDAGAALGASGLRVRGSSGVEVAGNLFEGLFHGFTALDSDGVTFASNEVTRVQGDGVRLGGVQGTAIEANWMHGFLGSTQSFNHSDMIQIRGGYTAQNTVDLRIASNVLDNSGGPSYQMIFGRNEHRGSNGWLYEDVVVEDNVLVGGGYHRISIYDTTGLQVRHNTLIETGEAHKLLSDGSTEALGTGWIDGRPRDAVVEGNIAAKIFEGGDNMIARAVEQDGHFNAPLSGSADLRDYLLRPDSEWNGVWGSSLLWNDGTADALLAIATHEVDLRDRSVLHLEAALSRDEGGLLGAEDARYLWTFSDGTTARGMRVAHDFGTAGTHGYELSVTRDGRTDRIVREVEIESARLVDLEVAGGRVVNAADPEMVLEGFTLDGDAIVIGPDAVPALPRGAAGVHELGAFAVSLTLEAAPGASGIFVYLHDAMQGEITPEGAVRFTLTTDAGSFRVESAAGLMGDGPRPLDIVYDGAALTLYADGAAVGTAAASGTTPPAQSWGLSFGRPWGGTVEAELSDVAIAQEAASAAQVRAWRTGEAPSEPPSEPASEPSFEPASDPSSEPGPLIALDFDGSGPNAPGDVGVATLQGAPDLARAGGRGVLDIARGDGLAAEADLDPSALDGFDLTLTLRDIAGNSNKLATFGGALDVWTRGDVVNARLTTETGRFDVRGRLDAFADGGFHDIGIGYDALAGRFGLRIDEAAAQVVRADGGLRPHDWHDVTIGGGSKGLDAQLDTVRVLEEATWLELG